MLRTGNKFFHAISVSGGSKLNGGRINAYQESLQVTYRYAVRRGNRGPADQQPAVLIKELVQPPIERCSGRQIP